MDAKWEEIDDNVVTNLHLSLADEILSNITEKKSAMEIWDMLTKLYEVKSLQTKIFFKRKLYTLYSEIHIDDRSHQHFKHSIFTTHFIESDNSKK